MPTFIQNSWNGGFSDDKFAGIANSFYNAQGVEIRNNPFSLKLANNTSKNSGSVITTLVQKIITVGNDIIAFGGNKIYTKTRTGSTWYNCYTDTTDTNNIGDAIAYNDYVYWTTNNKLHRIAISNIDNDWTGDVDGGVFPISLGNTGASLNPLLVIYNKLFIGNQFDVCSWDDVTFTQSAITEGIDENEIIRALTFGGGVVKIYSNYGQLDGKQYLWDGLSDAYNQFINWQGLPFDSVTNKDGRDYIISEGFLYVSDGYNRQKLKAFSERTGYANAVDIEDGIIKMGGTGGIWTFGALNKNYPEVLNFEHPYSQFSTDETPTIASVHNTGLGVYFGRSNGTDYGIDVINTGSSYNSTGYVEGLIQIGKSATQLKEIKRIFVSYLPIELSSNEYSDENGDTYVDELSNVYVDTLSSDDFIKIDIQKDFSGSYVNKLIVNGTEGTLFKEAYGDNGEFNYIQYKITLKTSSGIAPEVKEVGFDYDLTRND